jgi:2'-5' RNA ligase
MATRTFLALDIDECIRDRLVEARRRIDEPGSKIGWVAPRNLHLTLRFLGHVPDESIADVCARAAHAAANVEPFEFHVRGVITVPPRGNQLKMFWIGVQDPTGRLKELHGELEAALAELGLHQEDRAFNPHITLARIRYAKDPQALREAAGAYAAEDFGTQHAGELIVYGSDLRPDGPVYTPLARAPLGG